MCHKFVKYLQDRLLSEQLLTFSSYGINDLELKPFLFTILEYFGRDRQSNPLVAIVFNLLVRCPYFGHIVYSQFLCSGTEEAGAWCS